MNTDNRTNKLAPNTLAFIALCNEYCHALELADETECADFTLTMTRLLPRLYISASDLKVNMLDSASDVITSALDEDYYDMIRRNIEALYGENDTYLEVFEEDMKYSDTPIGASIAENLADIFQVAYNFLASIKDAPDDVVADAVAAVYDDFMQYWSKILVNVMRPLNNLRYDNSNY